MKNKNKLVASLIIGASIVASFGTAFALYQNFEDDGKINIDIGTVDSHTDSKDAVTYTLGAAEFYKDSTLENSVGSEKLSPDLNIVYVKVPLGFKYNDGSTVAQQESMIGRFTSTVTIDNALIGKGVKVSANLTGYGETTTYFTTNKTIDLYKSNGTLGAEVSSVSGHVDTAVTASGISCVFKLDFSAAIKAEDYITSGLTEIEKAFNISLSWVPYSSTLSDFDKNLTPTAYIRGDNSDRQSLEDYQMVPNIEHEGDEVEWKYKLLKGFTSMKVFDSLDTVINDNGWVPLRGYDATSGLTCELGGNATLNKETSYDIFYVRNANADREGRRGFWVNKSSVQ